MREGKVRENRLRRMAARQGLKLRRSPRRDENAIDYGLYALTTHGGGRGTIHPEGVISSFVLDLDEVEQLLTPQGVRLKGELVEPPPMGTIKCLGPVEQTPETVRIKGELVEQDQGSDRPRATNGV